MEYKRLGDLCNIVSGGTPSRSKEEYWRNGAIPWIKISNINGKYIKEADEYITELGLNNSAAKMLSKGTILYTIFATLGEVGILEIDACTNQAIAGINIKNDSVINKDYLFYYLKSKKKYVNDVGRGVAQNNINMSILRQFEVPVPKLEEQKAITEILDKIEKIISSRKQQLQQLDELVKARFVEMFGDPVINDRGWLIDKLGNYMTTLTDFSANGSYELLDSNVVMYDEPNYAIMVRTTDLESGDLTSGVKYIDESAYNLLDKSKLFGGELIMNKIGSAGKIYVMPHIDHPASLGRNAFMFRFDGRLNMTYLYALLTSDYGVNEIQQYVRGAVTKTITKDSTRSIRIIVPPIKQQEQFAAFVEQVDKSKVAVQKALDEAQTLFDSLMQKYF